MPERKRMGKGDFCMDQFKRRPVCRAALELGALAGLLLAIVLTAAVPALRRYNAACDAVCRDTLRLHVLANSDSVEDQLLKLAVRDALLQTLAPLLTGEDAPADQSAALQRVGSVLPVLQAAAERTVQRAGGDVAQRAQTVRVSLETAEFAAKDYGDFALPGGEYAALRVELGSAQGHNWFCVLYPQMCLGAAQAEYPAEEENELVFGRYEVRFAALDALRGLCRALRAEGQGTR